MTGPTEKFFDELARRGTEPLLHRANGIMRFDLENGNGKDGTQHWFITVNGGQISVSRQGDHADGACHMSRALFDRLVTGEQNAMAATLRGLVSVEGNPELFVLFQRLLPARPPAATVPAQGGRS
jgi:putative sterol carrier protein